MDAARDPSPDAAYDNAATVGGPEGRDRILAGWRARSRDLVAQRAGSLDIAYGPDPRNRLDLWSGGGGRGAPLLVFLHGGYWQATAKEDYRFVAAGALARGFDAALIGYSLAPAKTLDAIVAEARAACAWLRAQARGPLVLCGHSAGAQLAAMAAAAARPRLLVLLGGVFDLAPLLATRINAALGLDQAGARRNSPIHAVHGGLPRTLLAVGEAELPTLHAQSAAYLAALHAAGVRAERLILPRRNHYDAVEELARPDGRLLAAIAEALSDEEPVP